MIELASVKVVVDLFKELLDLLGRRKTANRETFDRVCKPLYEQLEPIAKQYYEIIHTAAAKMKPSQAELRVIADEVKRQRGNLIIARNGILGAASAFLEHYTYADDDSNTLFDKDLEEQFFRRLRRVSPRDDTEIVSFYHGSRAAYRDLRAKGEFDALACEFALSISNYFGLIEFTAGRADKRAMMSSFLRRFIDYLEASIPSAEDEVTFRELKKRTENLLKALEQEWATVSSRYSALKLYCEN
jgi:hypothetical protein